MDNAQYQTIMSQNGIKIINGKARFDKYVIWQEGDGTVVIKGKIMLSVVDKIIAKVPEKSKFARKYRDIDISYLTSDDLEKLKEKWEDIYEYDKYISKVEKQWPKLMAKVPREKLWLSGRILKCYDEESFIVALDVLKG